MKRILLTAALLFGTAGVAAAQSLDIDALIAGIDKRSTPYEALIDILQGTDGNRSLASFDAMIETGDATMIEVAVNTGISATDSRLRARALWEALSRRDALTIEIEVDELADDRKAAVKEWYGAFQTWSLQQKFPDSQCINLSSKSDCYVGRNLTASGLIVDIVYNAAPGISGQFELNGSGELSGTVMDLSSKSTYPARITFR